MFGLGMGELIVILVVALIVLGPKRLPEVATGLGKAIREFRKATRDLQSQVELDETVGRPIQELRAALRDEPMRTPLPKLALPDGVKPVLPRTTMDPLGLGTVPATATATAAVEPVLAPVAVAIVDEKKV